MDELERLMREATPLPWFTFANGHCVGGTPTDGSASGVAMCSMAARTPEEVQANAALIVAAVNALPELLALREEVGRLREALRPFDDPEECNRIKYGQCSTHACLKEGGWTPGRGGNELATCKNYRARAALNQEPKT